MSFETLNLAGNFLRNSQLAMDVASRNLSGANQPGYVRQTAEFVEGPAVSGRGTPQGVEGIGAQLTSIQRVKQGLLDRSYHSALQDSQAAQVAAPLLSRVETQLSGANGLSQQAGNLGLAASQLAGQADQNSVRAQFLNQAQDFASSLRNQSSQLSQLKLQTRQSLTDQVKQANSVLTQLADLNSHLVGSPANSMGNNALLDQRDQLLDQLHGLMDVQSVPQPNGSVAVYQNGTQLLWANQASTITVDSSNQLSASGKTLTPDSGSIAGLQNMANNTLPGFQAQLDAIASTTISQLNAVHQQGYGLDGGTGRDLFSGSSAADIKVAITDPAQLGVGTLRLESAAPIGTTALQQDASFNSQAANLTTPLSASGQVNVNGVTVNYTDSDTLDTLMTKLSAGGVQASYDPNTGHVLLARDPSFSGPPGLSISDVSGNLTSVLGINGQTAAPGGPADGAVAQAMANLMQKPLFGSPPDRSLQQSATDLITSVGTASQRAQAAVTSTSATLAAAGEQRDSVQGVNSDEELLNLTKFQQSYQAAAKVAQVADQVLQTLLQEI